MNNRIITPTLLREAVNYDATSGILVWKKARPEWFSKVDAIRKGCPLTITPETLCKRWNTQHSGRVAFNSVSIQGYFVGKFLQTQLRAHRVAWAVFYGTWPLDIIDHTNRDKKDNRIENLRDVSVQKNSKNMAKNTRNVSGVTGVSWNSELAKWHARIGSKDSREHLGFFDDFDRAVSVRTAAEKRLGYVGN